MALLSNSATLSSDEQLRMRAKRGESQESLLQHGRFHELGVLSKGLGAPSKEFGIDVDIRQAKS